MQYCDVPRPLQGLGITFITVGLMAMAMMCFLDLKYKFNMVQFILRV